MKMCKTILPCILLLSGLVVTIAAADVITEPTITDVAGKPETTVTGVPEFLVTTVPDTTGETVVTVPDTTGETVTPITKATVTEAVGKTLVPITETTVPGMTTMAIMPGYKNISTSELPSVKSFSSSTVKISRESTFFFKSTVPDTTGKKLVPITRGKAAGKTTTPVPDVAGEKVAPVMETAVLGKTTMAIMLGHKNISTSGPPSVKSFSSSTMKISRETTFFFNSTAKQLTLEDKLFRSTSTILTFGPEKEQQSSGLVLGLGIFFGILIFVICICCCIWKKSRESSFDLKSVEATIPLNPIEPKEPSSGGEKK